MATAQYEILIPKADTLGYPVRDLAPHAMNYLTSAIEVITSHVEPERRVWWLGKEEPFDALVFTAEDKPQTDSHAKQIAAYVGEAANQDVILVTKTGKGGIQTWPVKNAQHVPGQPSSVLA